MKEDEMQQKVDEFINTVGIDYILEEAEKMGITVNRGSRGWHCIKEENGEWVPLDIEKHLKLP